MDDYNFWADLLDTFQSSSDYIKTVILLAPMLFVLSVLFLVLRYRHKPKPPILLLDETAVRYLEERAERPLTVAYLTDQHSKTFPTHN